MLRLAEISRHTGLPLTTAHRLVKELADWGALEREPGGGYRIGLRLWEIASLAPRGLGLREAALPHLSDWDTAHRRFFGHLRRASRTTLKKANPATWFHTDALKAPILVLSRPLTARLVPMIRPVSNASRTYGVTTHAPPRTINTLPARTHLQPRDPWR